MISSLPTPFWAERTAPLSKWRPTRRNDSFTWGALVATMPRSQFGKLSAFAMLERAEDAVAIIKRVVDKDALRKQRVLQGRRNCVDRSRASFAHAFRAVVAVGRGCCRVSVRDLRNIHRGDRRVIA